MLVAAAVCPHPPLLVPQLAAGAAPDLDEVRAACDAAVAGLLAERPDEIVVVGADPEGGNYPAAAGASMQPYGVDLRVGGPEGELPLALSSGDVAALVALDPTLASALMVEGRAAWQVLAGAAEPASGPTPVIDARVIFDRAPYGVGYVVATWGYRTQ